MNVGSLFSGIGGFDLGLERAGFTTSWFCEQDDYCRRVLERHWPDVPCYPDVTELTASQAESVDVLCGGFPCQDLSYAGKGAGITGSRSGLWTEFARLIGELEPRWVVVENVAALLGRGLSVVLADLSALGYDAEWDCLPASAFGAPHRRDRIWIVAYPRGERVVADAGSMCSERRGEPGVLVGPPGGIEGDREQWERGRDAVVDRGAALAYSHGERESQSEGSKQNERGRSVNGGEDVAYATRLPKREPSDEAFTVAGSRYSRQEPCSGSWWEVEPGVGRLVDGFPGRLDQLAALGNALVPQIAEWIGRRIMTFEQAQSRQSAISAPSSNGVSAITEKAEG